jgi:hypothetical protein
MEAHHEVPYYPYRDYGQWGEYSATLSRGSAHELHADPPQVPPRDTWTGKEPKDCPSSYPRFFVGDKESETT